MKNLIQLILFILIQNTVFAQSVPTKITDFIINSQYLLSSNVVKLDQTGSTSVKYKVNFTRSLKSQGNFNFYDTDMKVGIGYLEGGTYKFFDGAIQIKNKDFGQYNSIIDKDITSKIDNSKLPNHGIVYLLFENYVDLSANQRIIQPYPSVSYGSAYPDVTSQPTPPTPPSNSYPVFDPYMEVDANVPVHIGGY